MEKNVKYAERLAHKRDARPVLRRRAPQTLAPETVPYPKYLVRISPAASSYATL